MISNQIKVSEKEFKLFSDYIESTIGIKFPKNKKSLLESRLSGHITKLGLGSFSEYYDYMVENRKVEYDYFIDRITTHTTNFFREIDHFNYLEKTGIDLMNKRFNFPELKIASIGTSTGEEMYSISMLMAEKKKFSKLSDYSVSGFDISRIALLKAKEGIFKRECLNQIPKKYRPFFIKRSNSIEAVDSIKKNLRFFILNAGNPNQSFPDKYHIVFCRNMLIYFPHDLQQNVIDNITNILLPGGLVIIGLSETFQGLNHKFKKIVSTIYESSLKINSQAGGYD